MSISSGVLVSTKFPPSQYLEGYSTWKTEKPRKSENGPVETKYCPEPFIGDDRRGKTCISSVHIHCLF